MKSSPVLLLSLGILASAAPPAQIFDSRAILPKDHSSSLASRSGVDADRGAKAIRLRRHKQALKRLRRRRAAADVDTTDDETDTDNDRPPNQHETDTDTDTDDDQGRPVPQPPPTQPTNPTQTAPKQDGPKPTVWEQDCDTTDTEWDGERRNNCPATTKPTSPKPTVSDQDCDTTDTEWEEDRRLRCPGRGPSPTAPGVTLTPAPPPAQTTLHQAGDDTDTDTDSDRITTATSPYRSGVSCLVRCTRIPSKRLKAKRSVNQARAARNDGSWTTDTDGDGDTTDCTSDEEWRRNCQTATRTATTLADVTQVLNDGSRVTVTPTPEQDLLAVIEHEQSGADRQPQAIGGAIVFAGLVAAAVVF